MKILILYDSVFGNTEKIAFAIKDAFNSPASVNAIKAGNTNPEQIKGYDLIIVGSPTRAFKPTGDISALLGKIPDKALAGVRVAAFDTRAAVKDINNRLLSFMVKRFGYAAERIADKLGKKGGIQAASPEGFIVMDTEGPLKEGEPERAAEWARRLLKGA